MSHGAALQARDDGLDDGECAVPSLDREYRVLVLLARGGDGLPLGCG